MLQKSSKLDRSMYIYALLPPCENRQTNKVESVEHFLAFCLFICYGYWHLRNMVETLEQWACKTCWINMAKMFNLFRTFKIFNMLNLKMKWRWTCWACSWTCSRPYLPRSCECPCSQADDDDHDEDGKENNQECNDKDRIYLKVFTADFVDKI